MGSITMVVGHWCSDMILHDLEANIWIKCTCMNLFWCRRIFQKLFAPQQIIRRTRKPHTVQLQAPLIPIHQGS